MESLVSLINQQGILPIVSLVIPTNENIYINKNIVYYYIYLLSQCKFEYKDILFEEVHPFRFHKLQ